MSSQECRDPGSVTRAELAAALSQELGVHAIPMWIHGAYFWKPRLSNGADPELGWYLDSRPTPAGWHSWVDAVIAAGELVRSQDPLRIDSISTASDSVRLDGNVATGQ